MATVDRISHLPEAILHHILSLLPRKDVDKTSALSKTFLSSWSSFPVIVLDYNDFNKLKSYPHPKKEFEDSLHRRIQRRNIKTDLQSFSLKVPVGYFSHDSIDDAIYWALSKQVKELEAGLDPDTELRWNRAKSKQVKKLDFLFKKLKKMDVDFYGELFPFMDLPLKLLRIKFLTSVTRLSLRGFLLNDHFSDLIGRCPVIERLQIRLCAGLKYLAFSSATIRSIELKNCKQIENVVIKSPSLEIFTYNGNLSEAARPWSHKWITSTATCKMDISNCVFLKVLSLAYAVITDDWVEHTIPLLANLEDLKFVGCSKLENTKISNENLKRVTLLQCDKSLKSLELVGKNLDSLNFHGCCTCKITRPELISFISSYDQRATYGSDYDKEKVTLSILAEDHLPENYFATLHDFIGCFNYCKAVTVICSSNENLVIPEKLRGKTITPLFGLSLKHFKVKGFSSISPELVDSLLWLFPSLHTLCFASDDTERWLKFERKKVDILDDSAKCCSDLLQKCWRHYFRVVRFGNVEKTDGINLRKYFQQNSKVVSVRE